MTFLLPGHKALRKLCLWNMVVLMLACFPLVAQAQESEEGVLEPVEFHAPEPDLRLPTEALPLFAADPGLGPLEGITVEDLIPPLDSDRGNWPNCADSVPLGSLQFEGGAQWALDPGGGTTTDLPEALLRIGVLPRIEFRVGLPDYYINNSMGVPEQSEDNWGDISLGIRRGFGPFQGWNMAVTPFLSLPSGANNFSSNGVDPNVELTFTHDLGSHNAFASMLGFYWPTQNGGHNFNLSPSVSWVHAINENVATFLDYVAYFQERGGSIQFIHFGGTYMLSQTSMLDLQISVGVTEATSSLSIALGYTIRKDHVLQALGLRRPQRLPLQAYAGS